MEKNKTAAFFDFDLTITNYDSFRSFLRFFYLKYPAKTIYWPYLLSVLLLKKLQQIDLYRAKRLLLAGLKHATKAEIDRVVEAYLQRHRHSLFNANAVARIRQHVQKHEPVFVVSSSPDVLFERVKALLGVTAVFANELEFETGRFTGAFVGTDCFAENKVAVLQTAVAQYGIDLQQSFAYSDHHSDIPMLAAVGRPVAVNPTPQLRRHAEAQNWRIEQWLRA